MGSHTEQVIYPIFCTLLLLHAEPPHIDSEGRVAKNCTQVTVLFLCKDKYSYRSKSSHQIIT